MRRRPTIPTALTVSGALLACAVAILAVLGTSGPAAAAAGSRAAAVATPATGGADRIDIIKVTGLIDPLDADLVTRSLTAAAAHRSLAVVIQLNSPGGTISGRAVEALTAAVTRSPVPVTVWVGGSGRSRAYGPAYTLARAADLAGEAPGSRVGKGVTPDGALAHSSISGDDAVDRHLLAVAAPTLVEFLASLDGRTIKGVTLRVGVQGPAEPGAPVAPGHGFRKDLHFTFSQLSVVPKLLHTAASPNVAFVMGMLALALMVFELFTAGVGVGAGTAALLGVLSAYGLGVLPVRPVAVVLLGVSVVAMAIDVQAGAPRFWTGVGGAAYAVGALTLYHGQSVSLWIVVVFGALLGLFMVSGMPAMIRTRFSTPTIGRQSMIGEMGVALSGVDPEGTVRVKDAPWRARTNRATPISPGDAVRVVAIDGLLLEVEPESGGARDAHH